MKIEKKIKGKVLCVTKRYMLVYVKGKLVVKEKNKMQTIAQKRIGKQVGGVTILSRLLRLEPRCAVMLDDDTALISINGQILRYNFCCNQLEVEHSYRNGMKNPLSFCVKEGDEGKEIYYGEYIWNTENGPVAIYRRKKATWEVVYEFPANSIKHIHGLIYDDYKEMFYIMTGDSDSESGVWISNSDFTEVKALCIGMQKFRACIAFVVKDGLIYATDTPLEDNYVYKIHIKNSGEVENIKLGNIYGPCIYGTRQGDKYIFSTSVEPDSSLPKWRYRFSYRLGKGVRDRYSYLFSVNEKMKITEEYKLKKDVLPMWLFQFGNISFPYNETEDLYIILQALKKGHNITYLLAEDNINNE